MKAVDVDEDETRFEVSQSVSFRNAIVKLFASTANFAPGRFTFVFVSSSRDDPADVSPATPFGGAYEDPPSAPRVTNRRLAYPKEVPAKPAPRLYSAPTAREKSPFLFFFAKPESE